MTKPEFIDKIVEVNPGLTKVQAREYLDVVMDTLYEAVSCGEEVTLGDVGKLVVTFKPERNAHNPQTGEKLVVPAHYAVKFRPSKRIKEAVGVLPV